MLCVATAELRPNFTLSGLLRRIKPCEIESHPMP